MNKKTFVAWLISARFSEVLQNLASLGQVLAVVRTRSLLINHSFDFVERGSTTAEPGSPKPCKTLASLDQELAALRTRSLLINSLF